MSTSTLKLSIRKGIAFIELDRPRAKNAINLAMVNELHTVFDKLIDNDKVGIVIISGKGKDFAGGADVAELLKRGAKESLEGINSKLFRKIEDFPRPTIAAIRGWCLGGACELAMACDIRLGGESAKMGQPEVNLGILPAAGATYRLPLLVGMGRAKEMIFSGRILEAEEAHRIGLLNHVYPDRNLMKEAKKLAETIMKKAPLAVRLAKESLHISARLGAEAGASFESTAQAILFESEDKKTRMKKFLTRKKKK